MRCFAVDGVGSGDGAGTQRQSCYIICCSLDCCRQDLLIGKGGVCFLEGPSLLLFFFGNIQNCLKVSGEICSQRCIDTFIFFPIIYSIIIYIILYTAIVCCSFRRCLILKFKGSLCSPSKNTTLKLYSLRFS